MAPKTQSNWIEWQAGKIVRQRSYVVPAPDAKTRSEAATT